MAVDRLEVVEQCYKVTSGIMGHISYSFWFIASTKWTQRHETTQLGQGALDHQDKYF